MEIVLRTATPEGIEVILSALVYAKILEEHAAVADLALVDRPRTPLMATTTLHISSDDLELTGSYDAAGDVLYLSAVFDDKRAPAQETPEGHAVRLDRDGRVTHLTAINAKWLLEREGSVTATLRDGRRLRLDAADLAELLR